MENTLVTFYDVFYKTVVFLFEKYKNIKRIGIL